MRTVLVRRWLTGLTAGLCLLAGWYVLAVRADSAGDKQTIYPGIYLDQVYVGDMTKEEAVEAYSQYVEDIGERNLVLTSSVGEYSVPFSDLDVFVDIENAVEQALNYGRQGNILTRYKEICLLKDNQEVIVPQKEIDEEVLADKLENEAWDLMKQAKDATISRVDGTFIIYAGEDGVTLMIDRTVDAVKEQLQQVWNQQDVTMDAVTEITHPKYTEEDCYMVDSLLGRYQTEYDNSKSSRVQNLMVGTNKVTGTVLMPGEQFSMYNTVAPFTEENGYGSAGQYVNNELVDGLGGGICQVSTTLYNAVLRAELQIDERSPHSVPVSYISKGMDAAIASGYQDFKFTNNTDYPIYIEGAAGGGYLSFAVYGHETRPSNRTLDFESQVINTFEPGAPVTVYDDTIPVGSTEVTQPHDGYYVEVWKHIYVDGVLTDSVKISGSQYNAQPQKTKIGAKQE